MLERFPPSVILRSNHAVLAWFTEGSLWTVPSQELNTTSTFPLYPLLISRSIWPTLQGSFARAVPTRRCPSQDDGGRRGTCAVPALRHPEVEPRPHLHGSPKDPYGMCRLRNSIRVSSHSSLLRISRTTVQPSRDPSPGQGQPRPARLRMTEAAMYLRVPVLRHPEVEPRRSCVVHRRIPMDCAVSGTQSTSTLTLPADYLATTRPTLQGSFARAVPTRRCPSQDDGGGDVLASSRSPSS